jgi:hypothetical protein
MSSPFFVPIFPKKGTFLFSLSRPAYLASLVGYPKALFHSSDEGFGAQIPLVEVKFFNEDLLVPLLPLSFALAQGFE